MATPPRPAWADRYLQFDLWTHDELRNLLCGFPPHPHDDTPLPDDAPVPTRQAVADAFAREEPRRVAADRHIEDAIVAGHVVDAHPEARLLAKIADLPGLEPDEVTTLTRAIAHQRACTTAGRYRRDEAILWAAARPGLFPGFPFKADDVDAVAPHTSDLLASSNAKRARVAKFGEELTRIQHKKGWSLKEMAAKLQVERTTAHRWLQGTSLPRPSSRAMIAKACGVPTDALFG